MRLLKLIKRGSNTARLGPWNYEGEDRLKAFEWESLPNEILIQAEDHEKDEYFLKLHPEYDIRQTVRKPE
jgi:hypothetical protein